MFSPTVPVCKDVNALALGLTSASRKTVLRCCVVAVRYMIFVLAMSLSVTTDMERKGNV